MIRRSLFFAVGWWAVFPHEGVYFGKAEGLGEDAIEVIRSRAILEGAGEGEDGDFRQFLSDLGCEFHSAHSVHEQVGDDEIKGMIAAFDFLERVRAGTAGGDVQVLAQTQHAVQQSTEGGFVVDYKNVVHGQCGARPLKVED